MAAPAEVDLAKQFDKEKNDPAMIAYLKSLGIDPDYVPPKDDPRRVVINKFEIIFKVLFSPFYFIFIIFNYFFFFLSFLRLSFKNKLKEKSPKNNHF